MLTNLFSKYQIEISEFEKKELIKRGSFGAVYEVQDKASKQKYAAKIIFLDNSKQEDKKMIYREIEIMIQYQHPTLIKMIGFSTKDLFDENNITIIMDYATHGSLSDILYKARLGRAPNNYSNTSKQIILIGIARGMKYLHDHDIIHRDLKPDNILLDEYLHPFISDFGLSKFFKYGHSYSQSQFGGTLAYMAPEIIEQNHYNTKVDVYAFGILMYEVVTELIAYPKLEKGIITQYQLQNKVINENYRPKFTVPVKESIKNLIEQCWSKDPNDRPSFKEIFDKLTNNDTEEDFFLEDVEDDEVCIYIEDVTKIEDRIDALNQNIDDIEKDRKMLTKNLQEANDQMVSVENKLSKEKEDLLKEIQKQKAINKQIQIEKGKLTKQIANLEEINSKVALKNQQLANQNKELQSFNKILLERLAKILKIQKQFQTIGFAQKSLFRKNSILFIGKNDDSMTSLEERVVNMNENLKYHFVKFKQSSTPDVVKYNIKGFECDAWILLGDVKPTLLLKQLISEVSIILFIFNTNEIKTLQFLVEGWGPIILKSGLTDANKQIRFLVGTGSGLKFLEYGLVYKVMNKFKCIGYFEDCSNDGTIICKKLNKNFSINYNLIEILKWIVLKKDEINEE